MKKTPDAVIAEARRLRTDERMSLKAISKAIGVSAGTLSGYLSDIPLSVSEKHKIMSKAATDLNNRRWSESEIRPGMIMHPDHDSENHAGLSSNQKGGMSEMAVRLAIFEMGLIPLVPDVPGLRYDIVAHSARLNTFCRIQVKTAYPRKFGMPFFNMVVNRNGIKYQYELDDFDILVVYSPQSRLFYVLDSKDLAEKTTGRKCASNGMTVKECDEGRWDKLFSHLQSSKTPNADAARGCD